MTARTRSMLRRSMAFALLLAGVAAIHPATAATSTPLLGGAVESYAFDRACPPGKFLFGFHTYVDPGFAFLNGTTYVKAMFPACAVIGPNGRSDAQKMPGLGRADYQRYQEEMLECAGATEAVSGLQAVVVNAPNVSNSLIVALQLRCTDIAGKSATYAPKGWFVPAAVYPYKLTEWVQCPARTWASGVRGAHEAGDYLNLASIGLNCSTPVIVPLAQETTKGQSGLKVLKAPVVVPLPQETTSKDQVPKTLGHQFSAPMIAGTGVDVCLHWGSSCGAPAADEFCRRQGFTASLASTVQNDAPPTLILGDNAVCNDPGCDRFSAISCQ